MLRSTDNKPVIMYFEWFRSVLYYSFHYIVSLKSSFMIYHLKINFNCDFFWQMELPIMRKKSESDSDSDREMIENCWLIDNMFTFENVGFSHVVGTNKISHMCRL